MKNLLLTLVVVAAVIGCGTRPEPKRYADYSQSSGFKVGDVDRVNVENLEVLAKVWGFAKYHHPAFANSVLNVDYELFKLLPRVATATKDECNAILLDWVNGLGEFKSAEKKLRREIAEKNYTTPSDTAWLEDEDLLGPELSQTLQRLRWAKRSKPSRYAYMTKRKIISFDVEFGAGPFFSDTGYDLLTLFRLWNMAEYYFPSVNITDKKWAEVLPEYIPRFLNAADSVKWTTAELITELSDTHSTMSNNPVYYGSQLPVELGFADGKMVVTDSRRFLASDEESVFELGDEIVSIGGRTPDYFVERTRKYVATSNKNALLREATHMANTVSAQNVLISILRNGKQMDLDVFTLARKDYQDRQREWLKGKTYYKLLNDSIGYLYPAKFKYVDSKTIIRNFKDTRALIIDMRCYPAQEIFTFIFKYFIPKKKHTVTWTTAVSSLPGYYEEFPVSWPQLWMLRTWGDKHDYKGKVVVLVNAETQSMAEYAVMAFQASPNCVVVGSQTAGADGNVINISLPRNIETRFSGIGVFYPNGTNAQRAGVRIDHYVTPTIEGIRTGRDELLEKAIELIN
jgi:C-terminal processing protease CtpA/Prc